MSNYANPCGVATSENGILDAYHLAYATDPESAFGGIIAFNRELDSDTARTIVERQFVEVIIAPSIAEGVLEITSSKKMYASWYVVSCHSRHSGQLNLT